MGLVLVVAALPGGSADVASASLRLGAPAEPNALALPKGSAEAASASSTMSATVTTQEAAALTTNWQRRRYITTQDAAASTSISQRRRYATKSVTHTSKLPTPRPPLIIKRVVHTTTPAGAALVHECLRLANLTNSTAESPATKYWHGLRHWLRHAPYQSAISIMMVAIGCWCSWNGPLIWQALFTVVVSSLAATVANYEAKSAELTHNVFAETLLMIQVGLAVGLAIHTGFDGSQVVFGTCLGFGGAYGMGGWARVVDNHVPGIALLWYTAGSLLGLLLYTVWRRPVLAMLAPLIGGFLVASGAGVVARHTYAVVARLDNGTEAPGTAWLPPMEATWFDSADTLMGNAGLAACTAQAACALVGVIVHSITSNRFLAVLCLVAGICGVGFVSATGIGCEYLPLGCPQWLLPEKDWKWLVLGCSCWALVAAGAAYRQLGMNDLEYTDLRAFQYGQMVAPQGYRVVSQNPNQASGSNSMLVLPSDQQPGSVFKTRLSAPW